MEIKEYQIVKDQGKIKIREKISKFLFFYKWKFLTFVYLNSLSQPTIAHHTFESVDNALNFIHSLPRSNYQHQRIDVLTDEVEHYRTVNFSKDFLSEFSINKLMPHLNKVGL